MQDSCQIAVPILQNLPKIVLRSNIFLVPMLLYHIITISVTEASELYIYRISVRFQRPNSSVRVSSKKKEVISGACAQRRSDRSAPRFPRRYTPPLFVGTGSRVTWGCVLSSDGLQMALCCVTRSNNPRVGILQTFWWSLPCVPPMSVWYGVDSRWTALGAMEHRSRSADEVTWSIRLGIELAIGCSAAH